MLSEIGQQQVRTIVMTMWDMDHDCSYGLGKGQILKPHIFAGLQSEALGRFLTAAVQIGFFKTWRSRDATLLVANSTLSDVLREDHYSLLKPLVSNVTEAVL